jgi:ribosomal subunit interface protein
MVKTEPTAPPAPVRVTVRGPVGPAVQQYAEQKIGHVCHYAHQPVLSAHVVLTMSTDPARQRPAIAEATLDVTGTFVRAQVAAEEMLEAVDLLEDRLRRRLVQHEDRVRTRHRWIGLATEHEWRHGDLPSQRPEHFPRPAEERQVIRRKTFALEPMTPDEAAFDMELLGHDFLLFTDLSSGQDAVIWRTDGGYRVQGEVSAAERAGTASPVEFDGPVPTLTEEEAMRRLDLTGTPFVFYREPAGGRGRVLYLRYDGHCGVITAAEQAPPRQRAQA